MYVIRFRTAVITCSQSPVIGRPIMKALALVLFLAALQTECIAEDGKDLGNGRSNSTTSSSFSVTVSDSDSHSGNNSAVDGVNFNDTAIDGETVNNALPRKVDLHCFTCNSDTNSKCGEPFNPNSVVIQIYSGKSVCYKFKKEDAGRIYVERGGMLDAEYLEKYESGELDSFPIRSRCFDMLCNGAPGPSAGLSLLLLALAGLWSFLKNKGF